MSEATVPAQAIPSAPGIQVVAVRTPTLPPATHTNCYLLGEGELCVVDPASPYEDQHQLLATEIARRRARGEGLHSILLTHHHHDHVAGAQALQQQLREEGLEVPVLAHPATAEQVEIRVDRPLQAGDELCVGGRRFDVHHTPGHAPGHVVLHDRDSQAIVAGDMVAGIGTILIEPGDGDLGDYLASLQAMRGLDGGCLLPAHGPVLPHADEVLAFYIAHRHQRSAQIQQALDEHGASSPAELVPRVYTELPPAAHPIAAIQILAHLRWLAEHGQVRALGERWQLC